MSDYGEYFFSVCHKCSNHILEQFAHGVIIQNTGCNHFSNKHHDDYSSYCISAFARVKEPVNYVWRFTNTSRRKIIREIKAEKVI